MSKVEIFNNLADCLTEIERKVWDLPHSAAKLALEVLVQRMDSVIDAVLTLEDSTGDPGKE